MQGTLMEALGIEIIKVENGFVQARMPVDHRTRQPFGYLHGGASVALAETVASVGAVHLVDRTKYACFALEINANHVKSTRDGIVTATASIIHQGSTTMIWEVKVKDEQDELLCISRCTMAVVPLKK